MENSNQTFSERMPKLGEIVIFFPNPDDQTARSNGSDTCPAIVTKPWSSVCINLKIVPDHGAMQDRGSVTHFSANPAGYHFMFQDEYEAYLINGQKNYLAIKRQLVEDAEAKLKEAQGFLEKCQTARKEAGEIVAKAKDLKPFIGDKLPVKDPIKEKVKSELLEEIKKTAIDNPKDIYGNQISN